MPLVKLRGSSDRENGLRLAARLVELITRKELSGKLSVNCPGLSSFAENRISTPKTLYFAFQISILHF